MIAVQQSRAQETGTDKQKNVGFPGVKTHQRHHTYKHSQNRGHHLHQGVELGAALPRGILQKKVAQKKGQKESCVYYRPVASHDNSPLLFIEYPKKPDRVMTLRISFG